MNYVPSHADLPYLFSAVHSEPRGWARSGRRPGSDHLSRMHLSQRPLPPGYLLLSAA